MEEIEKLEAGFVYNFYDKKIVARKKNAIVLCEKYKNLMKRRFRIH